MFIKMVNTVSSNVSKQHARTCNSYSYKQGDGYIYPLFTRILFTIFSNVTLLILSP